MKYLYLWKSIGFFYLLLILIVSLMPVPQIDTGINQSDKIIHFLIYFIMQSWFGQSGLYSIKLINILLLTICFGIIIEILQSQTSYRQFELYDIYANSLGSLTAYVLLFTPFKNTLIYFDHKMHTQRH